MKAAEFSLKALSAAVGAVSTVVPSQTTKDILKSILVKIGEESAELVASDGEVSITRTLPRKEPGESATLLLSAKQLGPMLRELPGDSVSLSVDKTSVEIQAGLSLFALNGSDPVEFPPVAIEPPAQAIVIPADRLKRLLTRSVYACDVASTRYALGGVNLELDGTDLVAAATDTRRLAVVREACTVDGSEGRFEVLPNKAIKAVIANLPDGDVPVRIGRVSNSVVFVAGSMSLSTQLVQGRFPDWRKVIPADFAVTVDMSAGPFHSAVRQSQIFTNEESRGVDFTLQKGMLRLDNKATENGKATIDVPISFDGEPLTITFDARYIGEFLKTLDATESVQLNLIDGESAGMLSSGPNYRYVIMPLSREDAAAAQK